MFNTRSICRGDAGEIGRHIGKYKVRPARAKRFLKLRPNRRFPKIALDEQNARNLSHWQQIKRNHGAIETAASDPPREPVAHVLTPTAGRSAQIDYAQSWADQFVPLINFLKLIDGAGPVPFALRAFDVRIGKMAA